MTKNFYKITCCTVFLLAAAFTGNAQSTPGNSTKPVLFDGILVAGYADHGAFINCAGPAIKFVRKPVVVLVGLLPTLRIKEDKVAPGASQNAALTPSLGFGITAAFKHLALQVPFYYNAKTVTKDGKWHPGIGLGYKF